jgi:O-antigen/teichoic acid export membrane protein
MISLLALLLIQTDKIVLSKMLSLKEFGYYVLASSVAASLNLLILPISSVAYPRLVELVVRADQSALTEAYHRFSQMLAIVSAPSGLILAIFSDNILTLWIQDSTTVNAAAPLVTLLAIGFMLNGFMSAPYNLQLAYGNMRFIIALMCILVLIFVPTIYFGALAYGAVAAGYAWIAINLSCIIFAVPVMHKNLTPREKWRWYTQDVALPVGAAFGAAYVVRLLAPAPTIPENWVNLLVVSSAFLFALFAAVFASPLGREMCVRGWLSWESSHPKP